MEFKLGCFAQARQRAFIGIIVDQKVYPLPALIENSPAAASTLKHYDAGSVDGLLDNWDTSFEIICGLVDGDLSAEAALGLADLRVLPPIVRPSKILCAAANFRGHVAEMRSSGYGGDFDRNKDFMGEKSRARPYLFLKAPSSICGPADDIVLPAGEHQVDWEAELGVVIGQQSRNLSADQAVGCVAGYVTTNDISCRTLLWREDRQSIRSDWLSSKSHDTFAPIGPWFVPRPFVADHNKLRIRLAVNDVTMQEGSTAEMIFSPDEQIEYASRMMTLQPGDLFMTGTVAGVGQGKGIFLKPGDMLKTEVEGLGMQNNRVVAART